MALLDDPTIQRILDEVNKAASGGVLGSAGNYIPEPTESTTRFPSHLSLSDANYYNQDQAPLFYPTPDMFNMNGLINYDNTMNLDSLPLPPNNFDIYTNGLYNTLPENYLTPYENYNGMMESNVKQNKSNKTHHPIRSTSSISSIENDLILEQHRHDEYPTIPPTITSAVPNLGLNIRSTTSKTSSVSHDINESEILTKSVSPSKTSLVDKDINGSSTPIDNENIDQEDLTSAEKIFYDPNPQVIQRKGPHSVTYKQNIVVRFLQPPPVPNVGPLVIKEVRAPPPPALPPLVIKQRPTPPKTPPPLIIREKPPPLPSSLATKVITRQLPPEPAPPRAVIIERLPPLPPKPRDIIIERWLPYEIINQKRKVVVQHAPKTLKEQNQPKNVIITYEPVHAKVIRNFQKQNVVREDPQAYAKRYASELYDINAVLQQARAAGVDEDLNPPVPILSTLTSNVATDTDYDALTSTTVVPTSIIVDEQRHEEQNLAENNDTNENMLNQQQEGEKKGKEINKATSTSPSHTNENVQEEDILVEENITPFYMNSGENIQETLHRLGIDLSQNIINDNHF